jgi:hypothetical protein
MGKAARQRRPEWQLYDIYHNIEHDLFEGYITEFTDIAGIVCDYYIRDRRVELDTLYGESTNTNYLKPLKTKLIYEPTEEPTLTRGFGISTEEVIQYASIPKFTFTRDVSAGYHPVPGDVLVTPWNNRAYEIADVAEEEHIFQLRKFIWGFILRAFRFSDQSDGAVGLQTTVGAKEPFRDFRDPTNKDIDTFTEPLTAFGDNEWLEGQSEEIFDYEGIDTSVYGY